jgi:hypothetical protein
VALLLGLAPAEGHGQKDEDENGHYDNCDYCHSRHRSSATPAHDAQTLPEHCRG